MWPLTSRKAAARAARDTERLARALQGQHALLAAAEATITAANSLIDTLKQRLSDAVQQYETTVRVLTDGLLICNEAALIRTCNPAAEAIFASTAEALRDRPVIDLFRLNGAPIADLDALQAALDAEQCGADFATPLQGVRRNGSHFPLSASITRLAHADGRGTLLLMVRDMTDLAKARQVAHETVGQYRNFFESSFDGVLIAQGGRVVAANPSAASLFGRDQDALLSTPLDALLATDHVDDLAAATPRGSLATLRDGGLELMLSSTAFVWNNAPACLIAIKRVTMPGSLEAGMRADNGVDMICVFNAQMRITFANAAFCLYYGMGRQHILGRDIRAILPPAERASFLLNLSGLTRETPSRRVQVYTPSLQGPACLQDWIDHAVYDHNGRVVEYQRTGRDITEVMTNLLAPKPLPEPPTTPPGPAGA